MEPIQVIVGEQVAGESYKVRKQVEKLIKALETNQFDIGDLLLKIQEEAPYTQWGYTTYSEWVKTTGLKASKARYLPQISKVMRTIDVPRAKYESVGIAKLRVIASLVPTDVYVHPVTKEETSMHNYITAITDKAITDGESYTLDDIKKHVRTLKGIVGDNDNVFVGFVVKRSALDNVIRPVLDRAKAFIGSVGKDEDGNSKDATDGAALEVVMVNVFNAGEEFLAPGEIEQEVGPEILDAENNHGQEEE